MLEYYNDTRPAGSKDDEPKSDAEQGGQYMLARWNEKVACFVHACSVNFILGRIIFGSSRNAPASLYSVLFMEAAIEAVRCNTEQRAAEDS